ncbi:NAD-dependent epimerase/dehydratase family protein [Candidatus Saccharibacteria bacterium]|nr:MAG: NAD-dependent epimerase/dehydratase family protein [Candidatus Saccharibacteria bacterium]
MQILAQSKELYRAINTDLAIMIESKAKKDGVKQFIFPSSAIIYGQSSPANTSCEITENTLPSPSNFYGDSKVQAEIGLRSLAGGDF